jgi:hypothetical protein
MYKLLKWMENVKQLTWDCENLYFDILGFPGNATMKRTCPHNNEADASRQQSKQRAVTMDTV